MRAQDIDCNTGGCPVTGFGVADWLGFAAAPAFAIMAVLSGMSAGGAADMLCSTARDGSAWGGMVRMYLLMSVVHLAPWLRLLSGRRNAG